jgi:hypothetical protein
MKTSLKGFASVLAISLLFSCSTNAPLKTLYYKTDKYASQKNMKKLWRIFLEKDVLK